MKRTKPRKYQLQAVRAIQHKFDGRALLADEMGLGKSLESLVALDRNKTFMLPALVICPASLKWNWQHEAKIHINMAADVLEGRTPPPKRQLRDRSSSLLIINYEILTPWMDFLKKLDPQLVIIDEVHRIKSNKAICTSNVQQICKYTPHLLALSGTPMTNQPAELFTTLKLLWPDAFPSFPAFAMRYSNPEINAWGTTYKGGRNLPELHQKLKDLGMIRRTKEQVLHELPSVSTNVVPVRLDRKQAKEYQSAQSNFLAWLRKKVKSKKKVAAATRAQRLVKIGYLRRLAGELKMAHLHSWIDNFLDSERGEEKLIVFGIHKNILKPLHERYKSLSILIDGDVGGKKRHLALEEFRHQTQRMIAFVNIQAGGVGLNMQEANHVLFAELPWTPAEVDQAISRAHRMGQKRNVQVYFLISENTIESKLCKLLLTKQDLSEQTLDGKTEGGMSKQSIFESLERELFRLERKLFRTGK